MPDNKHQALKEALMSKITALEETISSQEKSGEEFNEAAVGALQKARNELLVLKVRLQDLDDEDFDICDECGEVIPLARLIAVPGSYTCVKCAE